MSNPVHPFTALERTLESIGPGSVVTMKSGGPAMTVAERSADKAYCIWHDDDGDVSHYWFPICTIKVKP